MAFKRNQQQHLFPQTVMSVIQDHASFHFSSVESSFKKECIYNVFFNALSASNKIPSTSNLLGLQQKTRRDFLLLVFLSFLQGHIAERIVI